MRKPTKIKNLKSNKVKKMRSIWDNKWHTQKFLLD